MRGAIDQVSIVKMGVETPDAEGRMGTLVVSPQQVWGRVLLDVDKEAEAAGRFGEDIDIVVVLPLRTAISPKDRIIVALNADGTNVNLVGTYEVMTVDYMRGDLECEARLRVVD